MGTELPGLCHIPEHLAVSLLSPLCHNWQTQKSHHAFSFRNHTSYCTQKHLGQPSDRLSPFSYFCPCLSSFQSCFYTLCLLVSAFLKTGHRLRHSISSTTSLTWNTSKKKNPFQLKKAEDKHNTVLNSTTLQSSPKSCFQLRRSLLDSRSLLA